MARIVEIALNHCHGIREVCERPRRLLVRKREQLRLGKVQELDASCLRDLIRRPGHSILEKAGARQEIAAIVRRETVDTPENRVIRDLLDLCRRRARAYEREYFRALHPRVRAVWGLRQTCERLAEVSAIASAGKLVGPARPNYVLQKDRRYHPLWVQYDRLRREDGAIDSVWPTVRFLWADFVRAVVVSYLCRSSDSGDAKWNLGSLLTAYLRSEHRDGLFIPPISVSSRWNHISRRLRLFVVHPAHAHLCPGLERALPRLGMDLALVVYGPNDGSGDKPIGLLSLHTVMSLQSTAGERRTMEESLSRSLDRFSEETGGINVTGLLLRADQALEDQEGEMPKIGRLYSWTAPPGGAWWFDDEGFTFWLEMLLEELAS
jgi:hypothetical protein